MADPTNSRIRPIAKFFFDGERKFFVKGATYGPFAPDGKGDSFGTPERLDVDLALMRQIGLNVLRVYYAPPRWFLDRCHDAGIRVIVTLPWAKHIEFLRERKARAEIIRSVRTAIGANVGHPAI